MEMLGLTYVVGIVIGIGILFWFSTKSGKRFLEELK